MSTSDKDTRLNRLKGVGIEGSQSRSNSLGGADPRHRRGSQRELDFAKRFDPAYFKLDGDGRVTLDEISTSTVINQTINNIIDGGGDSGGGSTTSTITEQLYFFQDLPSSGGPAKRQDGNNHLGFAFAQSEFHWVYWIPPSNFDTDTDATITIQFWARAGFAGDIGKNVLWNFLFWFSEAGDDMNRSADLDVDTGTASLLGSQGLLSVSYTIPNANFPSNMDVMSFRLTFPGPPDNPLLNGAEEMQVSGMTLSYSTA